MEILRITKADRAWYEIILWWEIRRIPYNVIMYFIGLGSFYISYVTIPLVYIIIGLMLNIGYTFCWVAELVTIRRKNESLKMKYPGIAWFSYLALSFVIVFGLALALLFL